MDLLLLYIWINNRIYKIQIWDTAGQENFRSITRAYYKNSVCAFVVYDITNRNSFANIQNWIEDIRNQSPKTVLIILIGNKIDLEDKRVVSYDEGNEFAMKNGIIFAETSANLFIFNFTAFSLPNDKSTALLFLRSFLFPNKYITISSLEDNLICSCQYSTSRKDCSFVMS